MFGSTKVRGWRVEEEQKEKPSTANYGYDLPNLNGRVRLNEGAG